MAQSSVTVVVDCSELENDIDRIERGELSLPTVSAVSLLIDDQRIEEMPVYLKD